MSRSDRGRLRLNDQMYAARREREELCLEGDYRAGRAEAQPARITLALDLRQMYGPGVDHACHAEEPAVDQWEAGEAAPTWEQLRTLAILTDLPVDFFFLDPMDEGGRDGPTFICTLSGSDRGCKVVEARPVVAPYRPPAEVVPLRSKESQ